MAWRSSAAVVVASLMLLSLGTGLLILTSGTERQRSTPNNPPYSRVGETLELPRLQLQRFDFGKILTDNVGVLEREFTFTNHSLEAINIQSLIGQPSCCVKTVSESPTEVPPNGQFSFKLVIKPIHKQERVTWRGIATLSKGGPFVGEATADLILRFKGNLNDESVPEIDRNESVAREGTLQFVGESKPERVLVMTTDPVVQWTIGPWTEQGQLEGTKYRIWEASIRARIVGAKVGLCSTVNRFEIRSSGDHVSVPLHWRVHSSWKVTPKVVALTPEKRSASFAIASRNDKSETPPMVTAPSGLTVKVSRVAEGWELTVSVRDAPRLTLEMVKVNSDGEVLELPVDLAAFNRAEAAR